MKSNDDGTILLGSEYIRHHHTDEDLKSYMYKRQMSNQGLYRWNSINNENRVLAIDDTRINNNYPDYEIERNSRDSRSRHGAEIELRGASATACPQEQESRI